MSIGSSVLLTQRAEKLAGGTLSIHMSGVNSHALALATAAQEDVLFMHAAGALPTDSVTPWAKGPSGAHWDLSRVSMADLANGIKVAGIVRFKKRCPMRQPNTPNRAKSRSCQLVYPPSFKFAPGTPVCTLSRHFPQKLYFSLSDT